MAGITRYGSYLPYNRLQRSALGGGKGERTVASYDEDSVSMAVEAGRDALRGASGVDTLIFATTSPPYAEKLNAATIAAALDLGPNLRALELASSTRMGLGALIAGADAAAAGGRALVVAADVVIGAPGGPRESGGGDGAAAFVTGPDSEAIARFIGRASATTEILDVWRLPTDPFAKQWEERFGAETLGPIAADTATRALKSAGIGPADLRAVVLDGTNARAVAFVPEALRLKPEQIADPLAAAVGRTGCAHVGPRARAHPGPRERRRPHPGRVGRGRLRRGRARGDRADRERRGRCTRSTAGSAPSAATCPTTPTSSGAASCPSSRRAGPSPSAPPRRRCGAPTTGSTASSARAARAAAPATCRRSASA